MRPSIKETVNNLKWYSNLSLLWQCSAKTSGQIGTNVANLTDKDDIISDSEQIQVINVQASGALSGRRGAPLACMNVSWICEESPIIGHFQ